MAVKEKIKKVMFLGLFYGMFMFVIMDVMLPISEKEALHFKPALMKLLVWIIVGLVVSYVIVLIGESSKKK